MFFHTGLAAKCLHVLMCKYVVRTAAWQHFHRKETVAKQQIPTIYSFNTFIYWIYIVELLTFATVSSF